MIKDFMSSATLGLLFGFMSGVIISFLYLIMFLDSTVTHNSTLYKQGVKVDTKHYKEWVIKHEAELKIKELEDDK